MKRSRGSRSFYASSLLSGLALVASGCGGQADGDMAKAAEVRQETRNRWEQAKANGTYNQVKGQAPPVGGVSGPTRSSRYQRH